MPRDQVQVRAARHLGLDIRNQRIDHVGAAGDRALLAEDAAVHVGQQVGVVVDLAAEHHAIDVLQVLVALVQRLDAAVDDDVQLREFLLQPIHRLVAERRNLAVLLRRQAFQPGLARMHDEGLAAGFGDGLDEAAHEHVVLGLVHAEAMLDGHRQPAGAAHLGDRLGHQCGLVHQAGAEAVLLHALGGAAAVEVDLVVAVARADLGALAQLMGIGAAQLQRHRMLALVEAQVAIAAAVEDRVDRDHLGVEQRALGDQAQEVPAVPIGPVHHRGDAEAQGRVSDRGRRACVGIVLLQLLFPFRGLACAPRGCRGLRSADRARRDAGPKRRY